MSEKSKPQIEDPIAPLPPEASFALAPQEETERGAIDFAAIRSRGGELIGRGVSRGGELIGRGVSEATIAYHGISAVIARKRMERAGARMERMDHKQALYTDLEAKALGTFTEPTATTKRKEWDFPNGEGSPETAVPKGTKARTIAEKMFHKRLEQKQFERDVKEARRERVRKIYAYNNDPGEKSSTMGRRSRRTAKIKKAEIKKEYYRNPEMSPEDRRAALAEADANPIAFENAEQKRVNRSVKGAEKSVERTAKQPILNRWRSLRQKRAIGTIKRSYASAVRHQARRYELRRP